MPCRSRHRCWGSEPNLQLECGSSFLDILRLVLGVRIARIAEKSDPPSLGGQLAQEFEPFRSQCRAHRVDAGCVAAGAAEAGNKAKLDRICAGGEYDGNSRGGCLCRESRA